MLQGLECDMFMLKKRTESPVEDATAENCFSSRDHELLWTWTPRTELELHNLIAPSLAGVLNHFMALASTVSRLEKTIEVARNGFGFTTSVFVQTISEYLHAFYDQIHQIEAQHTPRSTHKNGAQSGHISLIELHALIEPLYAQITFVGALTRKCLKPLPNIDYSSAVDDLYPDRPTKSKAERTATIFRVLEEAMQPNNSTMSKQKLDGNKLVSGDAKTLADFDRTSGDVSENGLYSSLPLGGDDERCQRLALKIFFSVLAPYLEKVDHWMLYSYLSPSDQDEFCIFRCSDDSITSPIFWDSTYACMAEEVPSFLQTSLHPILSSGKASLLIQHILQHHAKQKTAEMATTLNTEPLEPLFTASKKRFAEHFNRSWMTFTAPFSNLENFGSFGVGISSATDTEAKGNTALSNSSPSSSSSFNLGIASSSITSKKTNMELELPNNAAQHTKIGRETVFFDACSYSTSNEVEESWPSSYVNYKQDPLPDYHSAGLSDLTLENVGNFGVPITSVFHDCVSFPILQRYEHLNGRLLRLLTNECNLLTHLEAAQKLFFLESPMSDLYSLYVFPTLWNYATVGEVTLNHWLKQALEASNCPSRLLAPLHCASLHIIPKKSASTPRKEHTDEDDYKVKSIRSAEDTSRIWIDFEASWPVTLFVNNATHELYNSISSSLVNVMTAQYVLEQLTTINKNDVAPSSHMLHKMQLFKNELLVFVRCIREYMVARITQVTWSELEIELRKAKDLDAMLNLHRSHLQQIRERCLLTEKFASIRRPIDRVVAIAIDFSRQFQVMHASMNPTSMSTSAASSTSTSLQNAVFFAGMGVDAMTNERLWKLVEKMRQEFLKLHKFLMIVLAKMSSSSLYLSDLHMRLNFSGFYEESSNI